MKKKLKSNKNIFIPVSKPYVSNEDVKSINKVLKKSCQTTYSSYILNMISPFEDFVKQVQITTDQDELFDLFREHQGGVQ